MKSWSKWFQWILEGIWKLFILKTFAWIVMKLWRVLADVIEKLVLSLYFGIPINFWIVTYGRREAKAKGGRHFKNVMTVEDILKLNPKRKIPASVEKAASKIISIKIQQSECPTRLCSYPVVVPGHWH